MTTQQRPRPVAPAGAATPAPARLVGSGGAAGRRPWRPGPALLGLAAGWVAVLAWRELVTEPARFLVTSMVLGLLMVLSGSVVRAMRAPAVVVAAAQVLVALLGLNTVLAARESLWAIVPTRASLESSLFLIGNGAATLNTYSTPISVNPVSTAAALTVWALVVLLAVDVLAWGVQRPSLAALPLLITLSVPVAILESALSPVVFAGCALLFLRLLATEHLDRLDAARGDDRPGRDATPSRPFTLLWPLATTAVVLALLVAPLVPVTDLLRRGGGEGTGGGVSGYQLTAVNPFIRLRRDLVEMTNTPLVYARTESRSTSYLRTTVLDRFTSTEWRPSKRSLPADNDADGIFPQPPGLGAGVGGQEDEWSLRFAQSFASIWLPLPYPIRELDVPGSWRYDDRTLDVVFVGGAAPRGLEYSATALTPAVDARALDSAVRAPDRIRAPMTAVPADLPDVITTQAREVTRGADTDFAKAVALQDWFRQDGGFRYSLEQRSGSGMSLLAAFVTDDRVGYCEQYASAMAAMGRALGIPSRVVVGFLDGTSQPDGEILYTTDDRHAWPEMYFSGAGWVRFEPTPSQRAGPTPQWTRQTLETPEEAAAPLPVDPGTEEAPDAATATGASRPVPGLPLTTTPLLAALGVIGAAVAPGLLRRLQRRRRLARSGSAELAEGAWAELRASAMDLGMSWPTQRSPRQQARGMTDQVTAGPEDVRALEVLLARVERGRYGPTGGDAQVDRELRTATAQTVTAWRRAMLAGVGRRRAWRSRWWPASLVRSADSRRGAR